MLDKFENIGYTLGFGEKAFAFIIAILAILSCSPVISIGFNSILIFFFVLGYTLFFIKIASKGKIGLKNSYLSLFVFCIILFLYIAIPFRDYDRFSPSVIWFFLFSTILLVDRFILTKGFYYFTNILYYICIAALIVLILNALGVTLPSVIIPREIGGTFTSYFISVRLSGQDYSILGVNLYRLSGIFAEPGHFGLILAMILFAYRDILKTLKGKVILLTCILTLSFGSFILLLGLLTKNIILEKKLYLAILIFIILIISLSVIPPEVLERFFFDKADGTLEERTSRYFIDFYNSFMINGNVLFGEGRDVLEINDIRNSDYRGFVIRYGYVGLFLFFLMLIKLFIRKNILIQFLGYFYFIVVFMHRSWFIDYFAFLFFLLILTYNLSYEKNKKTL